MTKLELQQKNAALAAENAQLRATLSKARVEYRILLDKVNAQSAPHDAPSGEREYPLVDKRGRHYRLEGRVRCFRTAESHA